MIIPILFIFPAAAVAADCEPDLLTRSQLLLRLIRQASGDDPIRVAQLVSKALAAKPFANPFEKDTPGFKTFERFYADVPTMDDNSAKLFRRGLMGVMTLEESFHLSKFMHNQEIPSARKH